VRGDFAADRYLMFVTAKGTVKRTALDQFQNIRRGGIRAIELVEGDQLIDVRLTGANQDVILAVRSGKSIRFHIDDVRPMGRNARGVKGIELSSSQDGVVGMIMVDSDDTRSTVLAVTEHGYGKRTSVEEYRLQRRGGKGIITIKTTQRNGSMSGIKAVKDADELMVITKRGVVIRMAVSKISTMGRNTQGVRIINLDDDDAVATIAPIVTSADLDEAAK
jgi:DNA gyrase subunit A